jgi:hypothetical protein
LPAPWLTEFPSVWAHNVDVSYLDPEYDDICRSRHSWPVCFYQQTIDMVGQSNTECDDSVSQADTQGYGFSLGRAVMGNSWPSTLPIGAEVVLGSGFRGQGDGGDARAGVIWSPPEPLHDFDGWESSGTVQWAGTGAHLSASAGASSWLNLEFHIDEDEGGVKFASMEVNLESSSGDPEPQLSVFLDGKLVGVVDGRFTDPPTDRGWIVALEPGLEPGDHVVSFRIDLYGDSGSATMSVDEVSLGWLVMRFCDTDVSGAGGTPDGATGHADLQQVLNDWNSSSGPLRGDVDYSGAVDVHDLLAVLHQWGECP